MVILLAALCYTWFSTAPASGGGEGGGAITLQSLYDLFVTIPCYFNIDSNDLKYTLRSLRIDVDVK